MSKFVRAVSLRIGGFVVVLAGFLIFASMKAKGNGMSSSVELDNTFTMEDAPGGSGTLVRWAADAKISGLMASVGSRLIDAAAQKYVSEIIGSLKEKLSAS